MNKDRDQTINISKFTHYQKNKFCEHGNELQLSYNKIYLCLKSSKNS